MAISGHKTRSVFDRYNIVNDEDTKDTGTKLEIYLRENRASLVQIPEGTKHLPN